MILYFVLLVYQHGHLIVIDALHTLNKTLIIFIFLRVVRRVIVTGVNSFYIDESILINLSK